VKDDLEVLLVHVLHVRKWLSIGYLHGKKYPLFGIILCSEDRKNKPEQIIFLKYIFSFFLY